MGRLIRTSLCLALLALVGLTVPAESGAAKHSCGWLTSGPQFIRAQNISCKTARHVANAHSNRSGLRKSCDMRDNRPCTVLGYMCKPKFQRGDNPGFWVRCTKGRRVSKFFYAS